MEVAARISAAAVIIVKTTNVVKRVVVAIVSFVGCVFLVYRGYMSVDDRLTSLLPLVMCLLFSMSLMLTTLASWLGDGVFSGLRSPD
jgi:hypothetical protein